MKYPCIGFLTAFFLAAIVTCTSFSLGNQGKKHGDTRDIEAQVSFELSVPIGWQWDEQALAEAIPRAEIHPKASMHLSSHTVIYVIIQATSMSDTSDLESLVFEDVNSMIQGLPGLAVKARSPLTTGGGRAAVVRDIYGDSSYQAIAYVKEEHALVKIIGFTQTKAELNRIARAFRSVVRSFSTFKTISKFQD